MPAWNALSARLRHLRHQGHGTTGSGPSVDSGASSRNLGPCPAPACISMRVGVRQFGQMRSGSQISHFLRLPRACARVGCLPKLPIPRACARRGLFVFSIFARVADFSDNSLRLRAWRAPFYSLQKSSGSRFPHALGVVFRRSFGVRCLLGMRKRSSCSSAVLGIPPSLGPALRPWRALRAPTGIPACACAPAPAPSRPSPTACPRRPSASR